MRQYSLPPLRSQVNPLTIPIKIKYTREIIAKEQNHLEKCNIR